MLFKPDHVELIPRVAGVPARVQRSVCPYKPPAPYNPPLPGGGGGAPPTPPPIGPQCVPFAPGCLICVVDGFPRPVCR